MAETTENSEKQTGDLENFVVVESTEGVELQNSMESAEAKTDRIEVVAEEPKNNETSEKEISKEPPASEELKKDETTSTERVVEKSENAENSEKEDKSAEEPKVQNIMTQEEWAKRESELLEKIKILQSQQDENSVKGLQLQLKVKCEENEILKAKLVNLQTELSAVLKKPNAKNKDIVTKIKKQHEELLTKAKGMIFDKTKMIKNQELQIEALTSQVTSLKEVASITKNLLEIRNTEIGHLQERLEIMDLKIKAERDRYNLVSKKVEAGTMLNAQLKHEYETQLKLFKELKERYEQKFAALEQNLQDSINAGESSKSGDENTQKG